MKIIIRVLLFAIFFLSSMANSGELKQRPFSTTPTWDYTDESGNTTTLRKRPFSTTPAYDWSDSQGNTGTIISIA